MPALVAGIAKVVVAIGSVIVTIVESIKKYIVDPILRIKDVIEKVKGYIEGAITLIQGRLNYLLDYIGADVFVDIVHGVKQLSDLAYQIVYGGRTNILMALASLYESIAGTASDIIHFVTLSLEPITSRLQQVQSDIKDIMDFQIKDLWTGYADLGEEIKNMNRKLVDYINQEIKKEGESLTAIMRGKFDELSTTITGVAFISEDVAHFIEMLTKAMET